MTLQQLEYVVALADHGQFLKAAEACDVTQPTLSSMIQKLEEELGAKLFDRRSKPVVPTAVGRIVVEQARELLNGARRLREQVDEQQSTVCGEFSVAVLPTIALSASALPTGVFAKIPSNRLANQRNEDRRCEASAA